MRRTIFLLFLSSCTFYPHYDRPTVEDASAWRTPLETQNAVDIGWWKQFGDEVLDQLIDQALANNQDLKAAISRVDQFQAQLMIARSKFYPQIQANGIAQRQKISTSITALPPGIQQIFSVFGLVFNASYLVDLWGEVRSAATAAYHEWLSSIEARRTVVLGLVSSVSSTYIQLRQLDQQLVISNETVKDREESLYLANIRFDLGLTSDLQVQQAITEVESAELEVESLQIQIAEAENLLSFLIGVPSQSIPRGLLLDQEIMPPSIPPALPSDLLNQRPDIRAAEERLIAANANIGLARSKFFPQVNLGGSSGSEATQFNQLFEYPSDIWSIGSKIVQEIFTGGSLIGGVEQSQAEKQEALHMYLSAILNAFKEANNALIAHKINLEQVETERIRVDALKEYLHLSDLRYKEGQTDYLTYLDAERHLFEGLLSYESAKANSFLSYIQIYQAFGGGWVIDADEQSLKGCER